MIDKLKSNYVLVDTLGVKWPVKALGIEKVIKYWNDDLTAKHESMMVDIVKVLEVNEVWTRE